MLNAVEVEVALSLSVTSELSSYTSVIVREVVAGMVDGGSPSKGVIVDGCSRPD